jgi:hypothetical protein
VFWILVHFGSEHEYVRRCFGSENVYVLEMFPQFLNSKDRHFERQIKIHKHANPDRRRRSQIKAANCGTPVTFDL